MLMDTEAAAAVSPGIRLGGRRKAQPLMNQHGGARPRHGSHANAYGGNGGGSSDET